MPERSSIAQVSQIGKEVTPGTTVAATKRLGSINFTPSINTETDPFRPSGLKFPTVMTLNREWADVAYDGKPTYEEIIYPLASVVGTPVVASILDGATPTTAFEWTFTPSSTAADTPITYTLEQGQSGVQAEKYGHVLLTSFALEVSRSEASISGSGFAQAAVTGIVPTAGLAIPSDLTPIQPGQFSVYMATTQAGLSTGGTSDPAKRLGRVISVSPSMEDRFNPAWFVDSTQGSFVTFVENGEGIGGNSGLTVEADAAGLAWLATLRAGTTVFLRIEALGPVIYNAGAQLNLRHMFRWDQAVKVESSEGFSDEDGIYAVAWGLRPTHDTTWGKASQIVVRNKVTAL
jgi:hypothetical protein